MNEKINELNEAIKSGELKNVKIIIENSPELIKSYTGVLESPMHFSARYGTKEITEYLFSISGYPIDSSKSGYETALTIAAGAGKLELSEWLLGNGANVNGLGVNLLSPLMSAVMGGHLDIVRLLVKNRADVNRMHVRTGLLPLDYAKSRGFKEIEEFLFSQGAKGHYKLPEWVDGNVKGSGILEHVTLRLGKILPVDITSKTDISPVVLKMVPVNNKKNRVLFTFGLFEFHKPMLELFIVLPEYWNFYDQSASNQFPIIFLSKLVEEIKSGRKIAEGDYLLREEKVFEGLEWPPGIAGLFISDVKWKSPKNADQADKKIQNDEKVFLFTLIPIRATTGGYSKMSLEKSRDAGWAKLTLNI
ncbi:ankyrin repeat domain-containing protein [Pedobacter sp. D749]|uniref:ankyrin repeat domain-containing protein n=1 Tax=Pedobacter sp. D749 TaxID=2856523 RepID=UPI001C5A3268|nr:ankyrin repeat domain-containing protein [Pedobacter sp. D749]QXU44104.1 ankyrin repeat domain-containing protein [Pedobacter sp. D749]